MKNEIWKDIKNYEGLYKISNFGRIKSKNKKTNYQWKIYNQKETKNYPQVGLMKNNKLKVIRIHRLVAETFIPNPNNYKEINHIDGNKNNNSVDNLEWCTHKYNIRHAIKNDLRKCILPYDKYCELKKDIKDGKNLFNLCKKYNIKEETMKRIFSSQNISTKERKIIRDDGVIFNSIYEVAEKENTSRQNVSNCILKNQNCKGHKYYYIYNSSMLKVN